ncbi:MAG: hypothetical protein A2V81_02365 [Candidatus Abawacabacteria bacterium RBG_16_42_10]|uniref:Ferric oxidoreductase domain-containing protein n=1 Tax=Candidatus Abawacabacteria bacterium RBG_16_42_10 TaxID=1817814 RepID=A0A1F4XMN0_9BACT|nr:MAG: hypothetical protein A2V81_02365 [Candidatus Abawacabacteria bacterium RBG_16_42_10]
MLEERYYMKYLYLVFFVLVLIMVYIVPAAGFFWARGGINFLGGLGISEFAYAVFPLLGLYAFSMLWLQFIMGSARDVLTKAYPKVLKFHMNQGPFVLLFSLLHPLFLVIGVGLENYLYMTYVPQELKLYAFLGVISLFFMILAVAAAMFRMHPWLQRRWIYIHYLNYLVFILSWLHSWNIGTDMKTAPFRQLWLFYGITAVVALLLRFRRVVVERQKMKAIHA